MQFQINQEVIVKYGVQLYQATAEQDVHLLRLWIAMNESDEISQMFLPKSRRLPEFLSVFQPPAVTAYTLNPTGQVDFIIWFTPFEISRPTAFVSVWSHASLHGKRKLIELMGTIYRAAFNIWPQLLGVTRQKLIARHIKMGYSMVGIVPGFYENEDGISVALSREAFEQSQVFKASQKLQEKQK